MRPQRSGSERGGTAILERNRGRANGLLWSFLAVSLLVHGGVLTVVSRHLQSRPLQIIQLEVAAPREPKVTPGPPPKGVVRREPVRPVSVPDVQPAVASIPEPPVPPKSVPILDRPRPTEVPSVAPRPRPRLTRRSVPKKTRKAKDSKPAIPGAAPAAPPAAVAPAAVSIPPGASSDTGQARTEDALQRFLAQVRRRIARHKDYPWVARRRHMEGRVTVRFAIYPDGSAQGLQVVQSSGFSPLDRAALEAVRKAAPFPGVPSQVRDGGVNVEIGIVFDLT